MIKKTLYISNPSYLSFKDNQIFLKSDYIQDCEKIKKFPLEDIGIIILDHYGITISNYLLSKLLEYNIAVIVCDQSHHPNGLFLNLDSNSVQSERFKNQINASKPLKKQLWRQTICAKILNQGLVLKKMGKKFEYLKKLSEKVNSGDTNNLEARASVYYWKNFLSAEHYFTRDRFGEPPNNLLNYGYAILRAIVARGLVASGLLPTLGIHHRNKYNAYCLADDIMEPYRPFVDYLVFSIYEKNNFECYELDTKTKSQLLQIPILDIVISKKRSPLMVGLQKTTNSLSNCFAGKAKIISYPEFI